MTTREQLARQIGSVLADIGGIREGYLFGSLARGTGHGRSDIDVAVFLDEGQPSVPGFGHRAAIGSALMSKLGTNTVDVVILNQAPPLLYHRVLRDGIRVFSHDLRATTVREGQALSRYCDYVPQLSKIAAALPVSARRAR